MADAETKAADYEAVIRLLLKHFGRLTWVNKEDNEAVVFAQDTIERHTGERPR